MAGTLRLPSDKLSCVQAVLQAWGDKQTCLRRALESLVGLLHHACKVVRPGRAFCRRMINLLSGASRGHHRIHLGREFRADHAWWRMFRAQWNGIGLAPSVCVRPMPPLYTDASGSWGCGAFWNQHWFQLKWDERSQSLPITVKEMLPIVISAAIWGPQWRAAKQVAYCCDNAAVIAALCLHAPASSGDYAGHSFRIGAATAAAAAGIQDSTIQTLGRWSSAAFVTTPRQDLATVSAVIARIA
ncbi:hypothetical protein EMCRGX_G001105 [Ephydatia muelleri]